MRAVIAAVVAAALLGTVSAGAQPPPTTTECTDTVEHLRYIVEDDVVVTSRCFGPLGEDLAHFSGMDCNSPDYELNGEPYWILEGAGRSGSGADHQDKRICEDPPEEEVDDAWDDDQDDWDDDDLEGFDDDDDNDDTTCTHHDPQPTVSCTEPNAFSNLDLDTLYEFNGDTTPCLPPNPNVRECTRAFHFIMDISHFSHLDSVYFRIEAGGWGSSCNHVFDNMISVFDMGGNRVAHNDDGCSCSTQSCINSVELQPGPYLVVLGGYGVHSYGEFRVEYMLSTAPMNVETGSGYDDDDDGWF